MISLVASLLCFLRRRRHALDDALTRRGLAHTFSLARWSLWQQVTQAIENHARGIALDAGSGRSPYKRLLEKACEKVTSIDTEDRTGETDLIADLQEMPQLADASFDTLLCTQVLEHLPRPWKAMQEMTRVLRPDGCVIVTVPHLSIIHEAPHDYYRYTRYGLQSLSEQAGLEVLQLQPTGGLFCFLGHSGSLVLMCTLGAVPGLRWITWLVNYLFLVQLLGLLDRLCGLPAIYPCDYLLIARKPSSGGEP